MFNQTVKRFKSLFVRTEWKEIEYFDAEWKDRIRLMANLIEDEQTVLDLGCGQMWLKDYLPPAVTSYHGCDYASRGADTILCDFNQREFPDLTVDLCFVSGCLEYIEDVDWFLNKISQNCNSLILSYCTSNLVPDIASRRSLAWKNHLSHVSLLAKLKSAGFSLYRQGPEIDGNEILKLKKTTREP